MKVIIPMTMEKATKKTDLIFPEKIVLLALDDKGWFGNSEYSIKFGLTGAILFELFDMERIEYKNSKILVLNPKPTDDPVLDRVLNFLKSAKKPMGLRGAIKKIVYKKLMIRKNLLQRLLDKKVIRKEEYSLMWIMYQNKFPLVNGDLKRTIREDLYNRVIASENLEPHEIMMLVVMDNCHMIRKNFREFEQYKRFRIRVHEILGSDSTGNPKIRFIQSLNSAINRTIMESKVSIHA